MDPKSSVISSLTRPNSLIDSNGQPVNSDGDFLKNCKIFVLYFSAHWCPPCRQFTPILTNQYRIYRQNSNKVGVIFVSGDRSLQEQLSYMREDHGDWPGVPCQSALQQ
jgi:nucleoredoxin